MASTRLKAVSLFAALATLVLWRPSASQSIAASLSQYTAVRAVASVAGINAKSLSGVAFHGDTRTLYVVDNDNAVIYELDTLGTLKRSITTTGITDPEGIVHQGDDFFLLTEEGLGNVVRLKLPRAGAGPVSKSSGASLNLAPNLANSGIEGVAWRASNRTAYAVKEIDPPRIYRIACDASGVPTAATPDDPFNLSGKSGDAADLFALNDGNFLVVNQEQNRLEGYDAQGKLLGNLPLGMAKPEGIAVDTVTGTLYVVGEPLEFKAFKQPGTAIRRSARIAASRPWEVLPRLITGRWRTSRPESPLRARP